MQWERADGGVEAKVGELAATAEAAGDEGKLDMAIACFRAASKAAVAGNLPSAGWFDLRVAEILYNDRGDREAALPYARSAEASLGLARQRLPPGSELVLAGAKRLLAKLLFEVGREEDEVERLAAEAIDMYCQAAHTRRELDCQQVRAGLLLRQGQTDEAVAKLVEIFKGFIAIGDRQSAADAVANAARVLAAGAEPEAALGLMQWVTSIYEDLGDRIAWAEITSIRAEVHMHLRQPELALTELTEVLRIYESAGRKVDVALCQQNLASVFVALGNKQAARELLVAAQAVLRGRPMGLALAKNSLSLASLLCEENPEEARAMLDEVRKDLVDADISMRAWFTSEEARVEAKVGGNEKAAELLSLAATDLLAIGQARGAALMEGNRAIVLERMEGGRDEALGAIRTALQIIEAHRYGLKRPDLRSAWSAEQTDAFTTALRLALSGDGSPGVAAELVESARAQAVPAGADEGYTTVASLRTDRSRPDGR